ncbi:uncharacterized protein A1O9_06886 [Exophiala aquamarina CBS 119918]|uniref:Phenylacetaldoxime dehydratase n=1 Tax=Exophiala aquamarina CBS 119918 TaxID=1182545 RepID=A0A072PAB3_9EURO|nr:uncharacterized protein A1O9_06886 [Exophiala aquamarina CBS 119918]KEF56697.1 hypothetical protein A1O9_06886 [Exophiala aquamarina CBS 119918]
MVWLANLEGSGLLFTYALFGVQHDELTDEKKQTVLKLYHLLNSSADRVDHLQDESHETPRKGPRSTTFVAYWKDCRRYDTWRQDDAFRSFWDNLSDDAGVWREVMTVPKSRYMFAANQLETSGLATMLGLKDSSDEGYWGVYRHRLHDNPDEHTDPADSFTTSLVTTTRAKPDIDKKAINLESSFTNEIKLGRVKLTKIPDNLCFCREGQRRPDFDKEELESWLEVLGPYAKSWMNHLNTARNRNGVVSFTMHVGHENADPSQVKEIDPSQDLSFPTEATAEANQLMYFLDLAHFEQAGRSFKDHVKLRQKTFELYGKDGKHSNGKLSLFVELCVLKSGDLDAEYVGCKEGTGLMFLEDLSSSKL